MVALAATVAAAMKIRPAGELLQGKCSKEHAGCITHGIAGLKEELATHEQSGKHLGAGLDGCCGPSFLRRTSCPHLTDKSRTLFANIRELAKVTSRS